MTQRQFNERIAKLMRSAELLRLAEMGNAVVKKVRVSGYHVRAYDVSAHTRIIIRARKQAQATKPTLRSVA